MIFTALKVLLANYSCNAKVVGLVKISLVKYFCYVVPSLDNSYLHVYLVYCF